MAQFTQSIRNMIIEQADADSKDISTVDGIYDGVYVSVNVDNSQTASDGTLYATNMTGQ